MAGLFTGMEKATPGVGGIYLTEGIYDDLEILAIKSIVTRKGIGAFCVELKVHAASGAKALPIGTQGTWMVTADKESFLGNVRGFLQVASSEAMEKPVTLEEIDVAAAEMATSAANPFAGTRLRAQATGITTKKGAPFTKVEFYPKNPAALAK